MSISRAQNMFKCIDSNLWEKKEDSSGTYSEFKKTAHIFFSHQKDPIKVYLHEYQKSSAAGESCQIKVIYPLQLETTLHTGNTASQECIDELCSEIEKIYTQKTLKDHEATPFSLRKVANIDPGILDITDKALSTPDTEMHIREEDLNKLSGGIYSSAQSFMSEANFYASTCYYMFTENESPPEFVTPSAEGNEWKPRNQGLYVGIHGLNGAPTIWRKQLEFLRARQPHCEIRFPYVPKQGNCSLEEAIAPIEAMMRNYIQIHPDNKVCMLASSNGARIAAELQHRLQNTRTPIKISCAGGVFAGTQHVDFANALGVSTTLLDPVLAIELGYKSEAAKNLIDHIKMPLPQGIKRSYDFFGSPSDFQIKPYTGSFPIINKEDVGYYLVPDENHCSIISRIAEVQVRMCINWMETP